MADESRARVLVTGGSGCIGRRLVRAREPVHDLESGLAIVWPEFSEAAK